MAVVHLGASAQEVACFGSHSLTARAVANNVLKCGLSISAGLSNELIRRSRWVNRGRLIDEGRLINGGFINRG